MTVERLEDRDCPASGPLVAIPTLFTTGMWPDGPLAARSEDPHYHLITVPEGAETGPTYVANPVGFPFNGFWTANSPASQ